MTIESFRNVEIYQITMSNIHVLVRWVLLSFSFCGLARRHYRRCTHVWVDGQNKGENGKEEEEEWQARLPINSS